MRRTEAIPLRSFRENSVGLATHANYQQLVDGGRLRSKVELNVSFGLSQVLQWYTIKSNAVSIGLRCICYFH